jgi:predicted nucleotidyltransferase
MAVTPADTLAHLRRLERARREAGAERARRLRSRLPEAVRCLREIHGARRVWLFGSLARGTPHASSDVDLAAEGVTAASYFAALADLMLIFGTAVDLVRTEQAGPTLRERILAEGEEQP